MSNAFCIRIGTRGSQLAQWQADWVARQLRNAGVEVQLVTIATQGDQQTTGPIGSLNATGVFTKEIQRALLDSEIDLAVHSLKDLPTESIEGLTLAAVPKREQCADVLVGHDDIPLMDLPPASRIGTGSIRRQAQILNLRRDLQVLDIRGNVETRIRKLDEGQYDAIVLAQAGLIRLELADRITQVFPLDQMLPAVGQGALGLETRSDDAQTLQCLQPLDDQATHQAVLAERSLLATLRGGCLAPVGAWARIGDEDQLELDAVVLNATGTQRLHGSQSGPDADAVAIGQQAANDLLQQGAAELLNSARS